MWIGSGLASAKFALFSWLGSASRTTNLQSLFPFGCHGYIMPRRAVTSWSILINSFISGRDSFAFFFVRSADVVVSVIDQT